MGRFIGQMSLRLATLSPPSGEEDAGSSVSGSAWLQPGAFLEQGAPYKGAEPISCRLRCSSSRAVLIQSLPGMTSAWRACDLCPPGYIQRAGLLPCSGELYLLG